MSENIIAQNKKAGFDYILLDRFEAGIELMGAEVKSIRDRRINLKDSFVRVEKAQAFVYGMHITPYDKSGPFAPAAKRARRLLLHKSQITKLKSLTAPKGHTIVPTKIYFKGGFAKLEIAVAKGKRLFDKRDKLRRRTAEREIKRSLKSDKR